MFLSVLPLGTVPKRKGGENALGFWNWRKRKRQVISFIHSMVVTKHIGFPRRLKRKDQGQVVQSFNGTLGPRKKTSEENQS